MLISQIPALLAELVAISFILLGMVAWFKSLGLRGDALTLAAFFFGLVFGVAARYADAPLVTFADWFVAVVFGLLCGLTATGVYKAGDGLASKAAGNTTPPPQ